MELFIYKELYIGFSFIEEQLIDKYFKKEMFEESKDFGILNVETIGNETYLKFRHETYQEYFSVYSFLKNYYQLMVINQKKCSLSIVLTLNFT